MSFNEYIRWRDRERGHAAVVGGLFGLIFLGVIVYLLIQVAFKSPVERAQNRCERDHRGVRIVRSTGDVVCNDGTTIETKK